MAEGAELKSENWVMVVSEQHRYQGVSYKSDIIVISGNPVCQYPKKSGSGCSSQPIDVSRGT